MPVSVQGTKYLSQAEAAKAGLNASEAIRFYMLAKNEGSVGATKGLAKIKKAISPAKYEKAVNKAIVAHPELAPQIADADVARTETDVSAAGAAAGAAKPLGGKAEEADTQPFTVGSAAAGVLEMMQQEDSETDAAIAAVEAAKQLGVKAKEKLSAFGTSLSDLEARTAALSVGMCMPSTAVVGLFRTASADGDALPSRALVARYQDAAAAGLPAPIFSDKSEEEAEAWWDLAQRILKSDLSGGMALLYDLVDGKVKEIDNEFSSGRGCLIIDLYQHAAELGHTPAILELRAIFNGRYRFFNVFPDVRSKASEGLDGYLKAIEGDSQYIAILAAEREARQAKARADAEWETGRGAREAKAQAEQAIREENERVMEAQKLAQWEEKIATTKPKGDWCYFEDDNYKGLIGAAIMEYNGYSIFKQDKGQAAVIFEQAAVCISGSGAAGYEFGVMCYNGDGIEINLEEAYYTFRTAAGRNYPPAQYNYAWMVQHSIYAMGDRMEAASLYDDAAKQQHPRASLNLAIMLYYGDGVPANKERAANLLRQVKYCGDKKLAAIAKKGLAKLAGKYCGMTGGIITDIKVARARGYLKQYDAIDNRGSTIAGAGGAVAPAGSESTGLLDAAREGVYASATEIYEASGKGFNLFSGKAPIALQGDVSKTQEVFYTSMPVGGIAGAGAGRSGSDSDSDGDDNDSRSIFSR